MRFKVLVVDHDDTAVKSTACIHFPAHAAFMKQVRPNEPCITLEGWFLKNHSPGIMKFLMEELKLTEDEHKVEYQIWRDFTTRLTPEFYTGFIDMLKAFRDAGGLVIVVSHSEEDQIKRHYAAAGFIPDSVYGWSTDPQKTKPNPWPVLDLCSNFNVKPEEVCVLDDLMPGIVMAKASGAYAAGACWGHNIPLIREDMKKSCDALFNEVPLFHKFLLSQ